MKRGHLLVLLLLPGAAISIGLFGPTSSGNDRVSVQEAREILRTDTAAVILDVRTEREYKSETGYLANAILIPVQELEKRIDELGLFKDRTIIVYCRTGVRSAKAAKLLNDHGFKAFTMEGGIVKWNELNLPVVKSKAR